MSVEFASKNNPVSNCDTKCVSLPPGYTHINCTSIYYTSSSVGACFFNERVISVCNKLPVPTVDFGRLSSFKMSLNNIAVVELPCTLCS